MAASPQHSDLDEQQLIEKHIDLDYDRYPYRRADAWLRESGVSMWVIVRNLDMYRGDRDQVARDFDLSQEEIDAALAHYRLHKKYVDARMYGPTVGDRVRLGDTNLLVEVERDEASPDDETLWGFGKTIRSPRTSRRGRSRHAR